MLFAIAYDSNFSILTNCGDAAPLI